ncbi:MAG: hypothetical protein NZ561_02560 [Phycisphaerae bacterium]|nr:hypothetical protein [Phycisphaerae bacterium]MDW8263192.1 hypothetical protein [Phycisphaerales bacterium]
MPRFCLSPAARSRKVIVAAVTVTAPTLAFAGAGFNSGNASWLWDADTNSTLGGKTSFNITPPSSSALPSPPSYQLDRVGTSGTSTATGKGSIGYVANATTAAWTFAGGSGASQADPGNVFTGDTITKVTFNGLFDVTSPGFGPTATGYFSLTAAGFAGIGGSTQIAFDMEWRRNSATGPLLRTAISDGTTFLGGVSGMSFNKTWTYCLPFSPTSLSTTDKIFIKGSVTFIADNAGTPSEVRPIQFETSAAPPTATLFAPQGSNLQYFNPNTWLPPTNPVAGVFAFTEPNAAIPQIPNGVGQRARIVSNSLGPRGLNFELPVTLGALHIEDSNALTLTGTGQFGVLAMNTNAGPASIFVGSGAGDADHAIAAPVTLEDPLEVRVESGVPFRPGGSSMAFNRPITAAGTGQPVTILGTGTVNYNAANNYLGSTTVQQNGRLRANVNGALGTGPVVVENGAVELNALNPFATTGTITVGPGGQVVVGGPGISGVGVQVANGGGVSGSSAALGGITVTVGGATTLDAGAFIGHEQFSLAPADNPQNLGNVPQFIFAISNDFVDPNDPSIVVGSATVSPWIGFGNDRMTRRYGDSPTNPSGQSVTIAGSGVLFSGAGELVLNARLLGSGNAETQVKGSGIVSLKSQFNSYSGSMTVTDGASLKVDGRLPDVQNLNVASGGALGGGGRIGGTVQIQNGGLLDPGLNYFNTATGSLQVNNLTLLPLAVLDWEFGCDNNGNRFNDSVIVQGNLVLDGELVINQLSGFDGQQTYTLFSYSGVLVDNGLIISPRSPDIDGMPAPSVASVQIIPNASGPGGVVVLNIPEPASAVLGMALLGLRRRRR